MLYGRSPIKRSSQLNRWKMGEDGEMVWGGRPPRPRLPTTPSRPLTPSVPQSHPLRLSNQFSSQVPGKTFSQLVWLSYAIQMLLQLTFLNQCNLTTRGLMSLNLRIWFNLGWPTIREPFKYYIADFFRKGGGGRGGSPKVRLSWSKTSCVQF